MQNLFLSQLCRHQAMVDFCIHPVVPYTYKYILPLIIITLFEMNLHSNMREVKKKKSIKKSIEKLQDIGFFWGV